MEPLMSRSHLPHHYRTDDLPILDAPNPASASLLHLAQDPADDDGNAVQDPVSAGLVGDHMAGYLYPSTSDDLYADAIDYAARLTAEEGLPNLDLSPLDGRFLQIQCMMLKATHVLEVGTMGGASSIWLASSSPRVKVMSVYTDPRRKIIAQKALDRAQLADRIEFINGEGAEVLPVVRMYVLNGHREKFGLVYIHGETEHREAYLDRIIPMCREGALIVVDNVVRARDPVSGDPVVSDAASESSRSLMERVGRDPRIKSTFVPTVGGNDRGEGFLMCFVARTELRRTTRSWDYPATILRNSTT